MCSSHPSQQSQYHIQANLFPFQPEFSNNWTKVSYKQGEIGTKTRQCKESEYWLNQPSTSNRYTTLLVEESEGQQHRTGPKNMLKPPTIYITGIKIISPLVQLLEQMSKPQYNIKALAGSQVKVQPKTSECYGTVVKTLSGKLTEFHIYKLKEERSYKKF
jgi:hypothetical protein